MACPRCCAATVSWCTDCELAYDEWSRHRAPDLRAVVDTGAVIAMVVGLGAPLLGLPANLGIAVFVAGVTRFLAVRGRRRRQQYLTASVPRALLVAGRPDRAR